MFNPDTGLIPGTIMDTTIMDTTILDTTVMTRQNYKGYVTIPTDIAEHPIFTLSDERFSNLLALWTLSQYGGVWITPSKNPSHPTTLVKILMDIIVQGLIHDTWNAKRYTLYLCMARRIFTVSFLSMC